MIDSLLHFVGYKMVKLEGKKLVKEKPQIMLDFNAIAQGYTVDVLAAFLESKGITNYLVELGGEVKAKGKKNERILEEWVLINPMKLPMEGRPLKAIVKLKDKALATSGNYQKILCRKWKKIFSYH